MRILSTLGVAVLLRRLMPVLEREGIQARIGFDPTARILQRIGEGERADLAILTDAGIEDLTAQGILAAGTRRDLVRSFVGLAVRKGEAHPRIGTVEELRETLLAAPSIAWSRAGASGIFFSSLLERLGLSEALAPKATVIPSGFTAELAARGEVAIAIQQVSELLAVEGIEVVGKLPEEANTCAVFSAALFTGAAPGAAALLDRIAGAMTPDALHEAGLEPATG